jgi:hypothetical protein
MEVSGEFHALATLPLRKEMRISAHKREEVTGGRRRVYNEELHNLYASPSFIRVMKSRRMRWNGNVARMGYMRNAYEILSEKPSH